MKNSSRVTNKMLQEKIENLIKLNKHPKSEEIVKTTRIRNLYRQSSAFYLWLITGVLGYATKIPLVRNLVGFLSLWYGRTTWWRLLVTLRKVFIGFNAVIGMYMVYKTTGFGTDNLLAGFAGMGHTYLEIFINFNKKVFNWLFDLFDHKVIPNLPNDGPNPSIREKLFPSSNNTLPSNKYLWVDEAFNKPRNKDFDLNEWIKTPYSVNINPTPWYRDSTTWIWFGGTMLTAGVIYLGYKIFMDPLFIEDLPILGNWFGSKPSTGAVDTAVVVTSPNGSITPTSNATTAEFVQGSSKDGSKSLLTTIGVGLKKLNPVTWFLSSVDIEANKSAFDAVQSSVNYDRRFYPFKPIHPYDHWLTRWRVSWLGETTFERRARHAIKLDILNQVAPPLKLSPIIPLTPSGSITPTMGSVGLGLGLNSGMLDPVYMNVASKFSSVATTPTHTPTILPLDLPFITPLEEALERLHNHGSPEVTNPVMDVIKSPVTSVPISSSIVETITTIAPVAESTVKTLSEVVKTPIIETVVAESSSVKTFAEVVKPSLGIILPLETLSPADKALKTLSQTEELSDFNFLKDLGLK